MEDGSPMDNQTKLLFGVAISIIVSSWTGSFFTLLRQVLAGYAFTMDAKGIYSTATAITC